MKYKIKIAWEIDTWLVTFPDFPEGVADGETQEEALENAVEALEACILFRIEEDAHIPQGSVGLGEAFVSPRQEVQEKLKAYWDDQLPEDVAAQNIAEGAKYGEES